MIAAEIRPVGRPKLDEGAVAQRREEILESATGIFARLGYRNTDVQFVADELGIGKGTVYRYFPSKEELFFAAVDRGMKRLQEHIRRETDRIEDPLARITSSIAAYLTFFDDNAELVELFIQERAEFKDRPKPTYFEYRDRNVRERNAWLAGLIADRRVRKLPLETISEIGNSLLYGTIFTHYFSRKAIPLQSQAAEIADIFLNGILTDAERDRIARERHRTRPTKNR